MQLRKRLVRGVLVTITLVGALALLGCPGDDEEVRNVNNVTVPLNAATAGTNGTALLNDETFTVPGSVLAANASTPALAQALQNQTPSIAFSNVSGANGQFSMTNPTLQGTVRIASCTFTVTGPAGSPLIGATIFIANCSVTVNAGQVPVGGTASGTATLVLNGIPSTNTQTVDVVLNADGTLVVDGQTTTVVVTGTTGG